MEDFEKAIRLLTDDNLVWSDDFETIRKNLAGLMAKANQMEYAVMEPEIGDLVLNLVRGQNARRLDADQAG